MSKESYVRGFCKAAEAAGVDPQALAKFAGWIYGPDRPPVRRPQAERTKSPVKGLSENELIGPIAEAAKKTQTNPTMQDLYALSSLDPATVKLNLGNRTIADYLKTMYSVNPDAAVASMGAANRKSQIDRESKWSMLGKALYDMPDSSLAAPYELAQRGDNPNSRSLANLNYAVATNMLDRIGQSTGRPMWDVKNARPTPYGLGLGASMSPARREAQHAVRASMSPALREAQHAVRAAKKPIEIKPGMTDKGVAERMMQALAR